MKIRNLTPHNLTVIDPGTPTRLLADDPDPRVLVFIPTEVTSPKDAPRAAMNEKDTGEVELEGIKIPLVETWTGEAVGLPEPKEGVLLVVSAITALAAPERTDLVSPHQSVFRHMADGRSVVVGVKALARPRPAR